MLSEGKLYQELLIRFSSFDSRATIVNQSQGLFGIG